VSSAGFAIKTVTRTSVQKVSQSGPRRSRFIGSILTVLLVVLGLMWVPSCLSRLGE
jgi:hypothetical protein